MASQTIGVLTLLCLFQVKHVLADFVFQSPYILTNRRFYGHPGGLLHVAIHLAGSFAALLVVGAPAGMIAFLLCAEGLIHYHLDWSKDNFVAAQNLTPRDSVYWYATGVDQALHHLTYIAMAAYWAIAA